MRYLLSLVLLVCSTVGALAQSQIYRFDTLSALTNFAIPMVNINLTAIVAGRSTTNDGLGGVWIYETNSAVTFNGYSVLIAKSPAGGRWLLMGLTSTNLSIGGSATITNNLTVFGTLTAANFVTTNSTTSTNDYLVRPTLSGASLTNGVTNQFIGGGLLQSAGVGTVITNVALANGVVPVFSGSNLVASAFTGNSTGTTNTGLFSATSIGLVGATNNNFTYWSNGVLSAGSPIFYSSNNIAIGTNAARATSIGGGGKILAVGGDAAGATVVLSTLGLPQEQSFHNNGSGTYIDSAGAANGANNFVQFRATAENSVYSVSNTFLISANGSITTTGPLATRPTGATWDNPSDAVLKSNIIQVTNALDRILALKISEWDYNGKGGTISGQHSKGVVAQDMELVYPDSVKTFEVKEVGDPVPTTYKSVSMSDALIDSISAIQELSAKLDAALARIAVLEAKP